MSDPNNPYGSSEENPYSPPGGSNPYSPPGSNPYGQPQPASNPYGAPQGGSPYGQPFGAPGTEPVKTDGLSIAALIVSFLCCLGFVGTILGFVGLRRTKGGQRKGRGLAIAAIVIGLIMSLASAGLIALLVFAVDQIVTPDNAKVGQCVDLGKDGNTISMTKADCGEEHDAEIVGVAEVTDSNLAEIKEAMNGYCATAVDSDLLAKVMSREDLTINAVIEDPENVKVGNTLVCYAEGDNLTSSID